MHPNKALKWIPPPTGFLKINLDGAITKTQVGVWCVNMSTNPSRGASAVVFEGVTDPPSLEAYA
jgi:hypothetical protein